MYWEIFWAFFIANILGYGGGPATIPLVEREVVNNFGWIDSQLFNEILAMGNALPGPIATKMAGYIGYEQGGILGSAIAIFATVAPSLILMIALMSLLYKYRHSPQVKRMALYVKPTIAILLAILAFKSLKASYFDIGMLQLLLLAVASFVLLEKVKVHPAFVVMGALTYGGLFL